MVYGHNLNFDSIDYENVISRSIKFIHDYRIKLDRDGLLLGLSGGLDSAVIAKLCVMAEGKENVKALILPEKDSGKKNISDAVDYAKELGIKYKKINITPFVKKFGLYRSFFLNNLPLLRSQRNNLMEKLNNKFEKKTGVSPFESGLCGIRSDKYANFLKKANAYFRVKHRIRMLLLYKYAELENRMVVGAANKTEKMIGFFVKHGCDHATDIMPILGLYKAQVKILAQRLHLPQKFTQKDPSPDIMPGMTDEKLIGMEYDLLDRILYLIEKEEKTESISSQLDCDIKKVSLVNSLVNKSHHMREVYDLKY
ncbi:MAG TPA: NAD(+) synthase [Victivallales bacterium]|nr:NAD(+) synthase [Victivallales bacterium]